MSVSVQGTLRIMMLQFETLQFESARDLPNDMPVQLLLVVFPRRTLNNNFLLKLARVLT